MIMAITAFPLDNTEYTAAAMGAYLGTRTRGVFSADSNLSVSSNANMTVTVSPGLAWLQAGSCWGVAVYVDSAVTLTVPTASGTQARLDAVCLRLDKTANAAELVYKSGSAAALPDIVRNSSYDEIYLASVSVPAGAVSVSAADISDLRLDESVCGLMRDGVSGIPTDVLQQQAEALIHKLHQAIDNAGSLMGAKTVCGVSPDGTGNVALAASDVGAASTTEMAAVKKTAEAALPAAGTAADSAKWGGYSIQVVDALPASPAAKTIYFVRKG